MNFNFSMNRNQGNESQPTSIASPVLRAVIPLAFGVLFLGVGLFSVMQAERAKSWPITQATVTDSDSRTVRDSDGDTDIEYDITYTYTVDGMAREGRLTTTTNRTTGSNIELRYNPDNPSETFSGSTGFIIWIFPAVGALIALVSAIALIRAMINRQSNSGAVQQAPAPYQPLVDRNTGTPFVQPAQTPTQSQSQTGDQPLPLAAQPSAPFIQPTQNNIPSPQPQTQNDTTLPR